MLFYLTPAGLVFTFCVTMLCFDDSTPKTDPTTWTVIILAALLWPATIPTILRKQYLNLRQWLKASGDDHHSTSSPLLADI